jgi:hypothetical protein
MRTVMVVQAEAILDGDAAEPVVHALKGGSARLAVVSDDGSVLVELPAVYVPLELAARLVDSVPVAVKSMIRRGLLAAMTRDGHIYVSLQSALDFRRQQPARRRKALERMTLVSEEGGLYDAEFKAQPD